MSSGSPSSASPFTAAASPRSVSSPAAQQHLGSGAFEAAGSGVPSVLEESSAEVYHPPVSRAERATLALTRSQRTRDLLQEASEPCQRHPDYHFAVPASASASAAHTDGELSVEQRTREMWMDLFSHRQERHAAQWKSAIGWLPGGGVDPMGLAFRDRLLKKAKSLVRAGGIPPSYRGLVWEVLCGARAERMQHPDYYGRLLVQLDTHPTKSTRDIEKDVARTMHGHAQFAELQGAGQAELRRGLCAFSFRCPTIGYAQSMSTVLAALLLHLDEPSAFWTLDGLLTRVLPADYYSPSMLGVQTDCSVLKRLVKKRLPRLHSHLHKLRVDLSMVALPWFMCLFVHVLPLHSAMRLWDNVFYKGSHVLLSMALALLAKHEDQLCALKTTTDVLTALQTIGKDVTTQRNNK